MLTLLAMLVLFSEDITTCIWFLLGECEALSREEGVVYLGAECLMIKVSVR